MTTAAIVPLLPGRKAYEGISLIVTQPDGLGFSAGLPTLAEAFGLGLGLAAGVSLGTYLAALLLARRHGIVIGRPWARVCRPTRPPRRRSSCRSCPTRASLPRVDSATPPTR